MVEVNPRVAISLWGSCLYTNPLPPTWLFPRFLEDKGIDLVALSDPSAEYYVALDFSPKALKSITRIPRNRRLLIAFEPRAVNPAQHTKSIRNKVAKTFVMSPDQLILQSDEVIQLGPFQDPRDIQRRVTTQTGSPRLPQVVILNENKFSFVTRNQYKMRYLAILELVKAGWIVNIGGKNWSRGFFWQLREQAITLLVNLKAGATVNLLMYHSPLRKREEIKVVGHVENGLDFLSKFDFALAIENDPQYLSEKLLNAIAAGCVPLYVGSPLANFNIPESVAITVKGKNGDFEGALSDLNEEKISSIREAGRDWLASDGVIDYWSHDQALMNMANAIKNFVATASD